MKEVTAYRCEYCGKVYLRQYQCKAHEPLCCLNPQTRPLCYSCQNYQAAVMNERMIVKYAVSRDPFSEDPYVMYDLNRCKARKQHTERFLFNKRKQSKEVLRALKRNGFIPMPSKSSGGCKDYKSIPGHPYSEPTTPTSK